MMYGSLLLRPLTASSVARSAGRSFLSRAFLSSSTTSDAAGRLAHDSGAATVGAVEDDDGGGSPLPVIRSASDALSSFADRLRDLSSEIREPVTLPSGQVVTLRDIVLHSRDADAESFGAPAAASARSTVLPLAEKIEKDMRSMADEYSGVVTTRMARATMVCRDTPCGGASWELAEERANKGEKGSDEGAAGGEETLRMTRMDTPCGRLLKSDIEFVELTHETREDVALGSRAACLLRMAEDHGAPLAAVRETEEGRKAMGRNFAKEKVPTPWVRTDEEYKEYFRVRDETK